MRIAETGSATQYSEQPCGIIAYGLIGEAFDAVARGCSNAQGAVIDGSLLRRMC